MGLLTVEQCREQCSIIGTAHDALLSALLVSAEDAASAYLNRAIFVDQTALDNALDALPEDAVIAQAAHDAALADADAEPDATKAATMRAVAAARLAAAQQQSTRVLDGIAANASIVAAVRMRLGHLFANRESVVVGVGAVELSLGEISLLRPYRKVMMP